MSADLLTRARSAVTLEEECDVIRSALARAYEPGSNVLTAMANAVLRVSIGELPRPVLLGVVAALVPEGWGFIGARDHDTLNAYGNAFHPSINDGRDPADMACSGDCHRGPTPALALLIAILEANHE